MGSRVRCICIESNEDHMVAITAELKDDFSLDVQQMLVSPAGDSPSISAPALAAADFVVTTVFHEAAGRAAAKRAGKPCIVLSTNPEYAAELNRRLKGREVTAVIADPRYSARANAYLEVTPHRGQVRFVLVDELDGPEHLELESEEVLVTRAARRRLGLPEYHLIPSPPPYISPASARTLCEVIVDVGRGAGRAAPK
ncbi:MAG TPA: hypothetical protein VLK84_28280, partial [Longimicrobium sp.]|nr:hypothetical protein [Longimicrobium sp.]